MSEATWKDGVKALPCGCVLSLEQVTWKLWGLSMRPVCEEGRAAFCAGKLRAHFGLPEDEKMDVTTERLRAEAGL